MSYFLNAITQHYADFGGRARRKELWMYVLFAFLTAIVAMLLDNVLGTSFPPLPYGLVYLVTTIGLLLPGLAVQIRRLHDVGKSGWFLFITLIPLAGPIWCLILMCRDSEPGANAYGPNPKAADAASANGPNRFCSSCGVLRVASGAYCAACGNAIIPQNLAKSAS